MSTNVSVINFKGGVGKTTLAFHLATYLARESSVLVVDLDHQSSLSIVLMGGQAWAQASAGRRTSNAIFESFCNRKSPMPGREIVHRNPLHQRDTRYNFYPNLDLIPAQFELDDTEIEMASTTIGSHTLSDWEKRTLLSEWLDSADICDSYDYVVFDCPPATKLVSQNAIAASAHFVVPVIPDAMSTRGVTHFRQLVRNKVDAKLESLRASAAVPASDVPNAYCSTTKLAAIVPFMAKHAGNAASGLTNIHTEQLSTLRRRWGPDVLGSVVRHMAGVSEAMDAGWPVWRAYRTQNVAKVIKEMEDTCREIASRIQ